LNDVNFGNVCDCNDNNACTTDSCDPVLGCIFNPLTCADDNNACTSNACDPVAGCAYPPSVVCPAAPECKTNTCNPATGVCAQQDLPNGTTCTDGVGCTGNDVCTNGTCGGSDNCAETLGLCGVDGACNLSTGACVYDNVGCVANRFYALVENSSGSVVGAIRCTAGPPIACDRDLNGVLVVYTDINTCGGEP
jgi:hypothetical protein